MRPLLLLSVVCLVASACGGDSTPTRPTPVTPMIAQVSGVWTFSETFNSISGGECVGSALQAVVGQRATGTVQIQQSGASLTATITDDSTGASCSYTGTAGASSIALNTNSCTASNILGARCSNGNVRNVLLQTGAINATVVGSSATGTEAETYNVTTTSGSPVAIMTINASFSATRR